TCDNEQWLIGKKCNFGARKYCSRSCINRGRKHTSEWKDKMSIKHSGENNPFYNMRHLEETKNKMSKSHTVNNSLKAVKMKELSEDDFESYWSCYRKKLSGSNNHFFGKTHSKTTRE